MTSLSLIHSSEVLSRVSICCWTLAATLGSLPSLDMILLFLHLRQLQPTISTSLLTFGCGSATVFTSSLAASASGTSTALSVTVTQSPTRIVAPLGAAKAYWPNTGLSEPMSVSCTSAAVTLQ